MGSSFSRHYGRNPAQKSPSAAFGRLRIDSPRPQRHHHGHHGLPTSSSLPKIAVAASAASAAAVSAQRVATEASPLVVRKLESLASSEMSEAAVAPPVVVWIGPALVCALMYALYNIFIKKGSASIHPILGGVILQFVAAILGTCLLAVLVYKDGGTEDMQYDYQGIKFAILAGAAVGAAEILSFVVSGMGVQAMQSIPIIIGGSVLFGTILGFVALKELLTYQGWIGVGLIAAGIGLVGTDPGGAGGIHG